MGSWFRVWGLGSLRAWLCAMCSSGVGGFGCKGLWLLGALGRVWQTLIREVFDFCRTVLSAAQAVICRRHNASSLKWPVLKNTPYRPTPCARFFTKKSGLPVEVSGRYTKVALP